MKLPRMVTNPPIPHGVYKQLQEEERHDEIVNELIKLVELKESEVEETKKEAKKLSIYNAWMMVFSILSALIALASWLLPNILEGAAQ